MRQRARADNLTTCHRKNKLKSVFHLPVLLLIINFVITLSKYFDSVATKFMINDNRTDAWKTDVNLLIRKRKKHLGKFFKRFRSWAAIINQTVVSHLKYNFFPGWHDNKSISESVPMETSICGKYKERHCCLFPYNKIRDLRKIKLWLNLPKVNQPTLRLHWNVDKGL